MAGVLRHSCLNAAHDRLLLRPFAVKTANSTTLQVRVKPRARVSLLTPVEGGVWVAQLKSPPVDGKANDELVALLARHFGCRRSAVSLKSGASARLKLVQIEGSHKSVQNEV